MLVAVEQLELWVQNVGLIIHYFLSDNTPLIHLEGQMVRNHHNVHDVNQN